MSYIKREGKLKKEEKQKICHSSCRLGHKRTPTLQELHIPMASLSRSGVHLPDHSPCIPPNKLPPFTPILDHSPCSPDIQTSFSLNTLPWYQSISSVAYPLNNYQHTLLQDTLHLRKPSSVLSFRPFFTLHNSLIRAFGTLSIPRQNLVLYPTEFKAAPLPISVQTKKYTLIMGIKEFS